MMDWLLSLIPGGAVGAYAASAAVLATVVGTLLWAIRQGGKDSARAEEAERRERNLQKIKRAADARPHGSVHDDPNNRDR